MDTHVGVLSSPSNAELIELIGNRIENRLFAILPAASREMYIINTCLPNLGDRRTVTHLDLEAVCKKGHITDRASAEKPEPGWHLTINGNDAGGDGLVIMLFVPDDPHEPIQVTGFTIPQT
jgi:hypothetical protein